MVSNTHKIIINSMIGGLLVFFGAAITTLQTYGFSDISNLLLGALLGMFAGIVIFLSKLQTYFSPDLVPSGTKGEVKIFDFV